MPKDLLRKLPQMSKIIERFKDRYPAEVVKYVAEKVLSRVREEILSGKIKSVPDIFEEVERALKGMGGLRRVINATGVIINTNLGRAPLAREALKLIEEVALSYSNLEYDLERGERGSRIKHVEDLICALTGSEASFVVNNNAGAVFLVLNTLARGKEVVVSRGELIEIGGSFRMPDIMEASGCILREVGTTNRTRLRDYEEAVGENTAMLLKVYRSNFYMEGFVEEVPLEELSHLARRRGLYLYYDEGSGALMNVHLKEVNFREAIKKGADVVSGSGDKLFGGPQGGIIAGREEIVKRIRENPLARILRVDKVTLAALEATLRLYLERRYDEIPVIRMLTEKEGSIRRRAYRLYRRLKKFRDLEVRVVKDFARPGGGSLPEVQLPTYCVALRCPGLSAHRMQELLRNSEPPVIGRIKDNTLLLDMRTVSNEELKDIEKVLHELLKLLKSL